jgi:ribulose-5-phosphate 4-epimerase/fuculose-1-phosphate aldolase
MILSGRNRYIYSKQSQCHFVQHKSNKDRFDIELRSPQGQAWATAGPTISLTTQEYIKVLGQHTKYFTLYNLGASLLTRVYRHVCVMGYKQSSVLVH